jgi:hypothetical protein
MRRLSGVLLCLLLACKAGDPDSAASHALAWMGVRPSSGFAVKRADVAAAYPSYRFIKTRPAPTAASSTDWYYGDGDDVLVLGADDRTDRLYAASMLVKRRSGDGPQERVLRFMKSVLKLVDVCTPGWTPGERDQWEKDALLAFGNSAVTSIPRRGLGLLFSEYGGDLIALIISPGANPSRSDREAGGRTEQNVQGTQSAPGSRNESRVEHSLAAGYKGVTWGTACADAVTQLSQRGFRFNDAAIDALRRNDSHVTSYLASHILKLLSESIGVCETKDVARWRDVGGLLENTEIAASVICTDGRFSAIEFTAEDEDGVGALNSQGAGKVLAETVRTEWGDLTPTRWMHLEANGAARFLSVRQGVTLSQRPAAQLVLVSPREIERINSELQECAAARARRQDSLRAMVQ